MRHPERSDGWRSVVVRLKKERRMEQSDGRLPWFRRREGSIAVMMVDEEEEDTASE